MADLNQLPTELEAIGVFGSNNIPVRINSTWYKFFLSVSNLLGNFVGGVLGFSLAPAVTATGASQASAHQLTTEWAVIRGGGIGTGVLLNNYGPGTMTWVFNPSGVSKNVYPPVGSVIDGLAVNAPYLLNTGKMQVFSQVDANQYQSMQLG